MQEFAPRNSNPPPTEHWPSSEELAAYIDGTLDEAERERITEHLASCEECYAVYSETLHFQLEPSQPPDKNVVDFPKPPARQPSWWWRAAAAAVVLLCLGGSVLLLTAPKLATSEVAGIVPSPSSDEAFWNGKTMRGDGASPEAEVPYGQISFGMGVKIVDLQVALQANRKQASETAFAGIYNLLGSLAGGSDLQKEYEGVRYSRVKRSRSELLPATTRLAREAKDLLDKEPLDFGQWVEAGRVTSFLRDPKFLQQPANRFFLSRFLWRQKLGLSETKADPEVLQALEEISRLLGKGSLAQSDYDKLRRSFDRILDIYYPAT